MEDILNKDQIKLLQDKKWEVKPKGCWLELYKEDYSETGWEEICKVVGVSVERNSVKALIFATA